MAGGAIVGMGGDQIPLHQINVCQKPQTLIFISPSSPFPKEGKQAEFVLGLSLLFLAHQQ